MLFDLRNVSYRYPDGTLALCSVDLGLPENSSIAILGANGSGKSTLLRLLDGLQFPSEGRIEFCGQEISEEALRNDSLRQSFRQRVGFVFQNTDAQLFNATVFEEIAFGPRQLGLREEEARKRVEDTLAHLGIRHLSDRAPFRLSGGEKRKVVLASVLSMNPQVLLLDEPFLGLDPRGQSWLARTLRQLQAAGKTTIVATHTIDMVSRIAELAVVIGEDHRVLSVGPVDETLANEQLLLNANLIEEVGMAP